MYNFVVGGFLPGTNIQISFQVWLGIFTIVAGSGLIVWLEYKQRLVSRGLKATRRVLNASELHYRIRRSLA